MTTDISPSPVVGREAVERWLTDAANHPDHPHDVQRIETHISQVFLTDRFVYKLKKPVRFDFLDFNSLEKREHACREELRLNRRMAGDVYRAVLPITADRCGALALDGSGTVVDWVVQMRRLPADRMLDELIRTDRLHESEVRKLTEYLGGYYSAIEPLVVRPRDFHAALVANVEANLAALLGADGVDTTRIRRLHIFQLRLLKSRPELFQARVLDGRIIDGHGDLRPEHICLTDPPVVFDCLEFSADLRRIDVLDELCFLAMECDALGADSLGERVLKHYFQRSQDRPPPELTAFHKTYRACVRAKVAILRGAQLPADARDAQRQLGERYLALGDRYLREIDARPVLILVTGLMGTGKTTLARVLAAELGIEMLRTDDVRDELFPAAGGNDAFGQGRYSPEARARVYEEVLRRASEALSRGVSIILDGTYTKASDRELALERGRAAEADVLAVECVCPREVALERIQTRLRQPQPDASEARPELYDRQAAQRDPPADSIPTCSVDTTESLAAQTATVMAALI
ncbi:MAG: AAA family ATPase [Planctomycetia bacterium]|nr:AAA family ATPase [Planctomycetia bacterium]